MKLFKKIIGLDKPTVSQEGSSVKDKIKEIQDIYQLQKQNLDIIKEIQKQSGK